MSLALVLISSSGESPYLDIEKKGQEATFAKLDSEIIFRWAEGDPLKRREPLARFVNSVVATHRRIGRQSGVQFRPFAGHQAGKSAAKARLLSPKGRDLSNFVLQVDFSLYRLRATIVGALSRGVWLLAYQRGNRRFSKRRFRLIAPSSYHLNPMRMLEKLTIFVTETTCNYLLLTTSTCYVNVTALRQTLRRMPSSRVYAGTVLRFEGQEFVAGNNILISRDVANLVLKNRRNLRHDVPDDVALGILVSELGICSPAEIAAEETPLGPFSEDSLSATWKDKPVIRCKVSPRTKDSSEVVSRLHMVHRLLSEN